LKFRLNFIQALSDKSLRTSTKDMKLKNGFLLFLIISTLQFSLAQKAQAADTPEGLVFFPSISLRQQSGTLAGDQSVFITDLRVGYRIASGFYFGMIYSNTSAGGSTTINESDIGNSVGYFSGVFGFITSVYMISKEAENSPTTAVTRTEGLGIQLDLSFTFQLDTDFSAGPVFTLKNINYRKEEDGSGAISNVMRTTNYLSPFLGVLVIF